MEVTIWLSRCCACEGSTSTSTRHTQKLQTNTFKEDNILRQSKQQEHSRAYGFQTTMLRLEANGTLNVLRGFFIPAILDGTGMLLPSAGSHRGGRLSMIARCAEFHPILYTCVGRPSSESSNVSLWCMFSNFTSSKHHVPSTCHGMVDSVCHRLQPQCTLIPLIAGEVAQRRTGCA